MSSIGPDKVPRGSWIFFLFEFIFLRFWLKISVYNWWSRGYPYCAALSGFMLCFCRIKNFVLYSIVALKNKYIFLYKFDACLCNVQFGMCNVCIYHYSSFIPLITIVTPCITGKVLFKVCVLLIFNFWILLVPERFCYLTNKVVCVTDKQMFVASERYVVILWIV